MTDAGKQRRTEELFALASEAARVEMRRSLRDPVLWAAQVVECTAAATKLLRQGLLLGLGVMYFLRWREQAALQVVSMPALLVFALNPRRLFWKNLFRMRADAAFDNALQSAR